jgi:hypothetical protein
LITKFSINPKYELGQLRKALIYAQEAEKIAEYIKTSVAERKEIVADCARFKNAADLVKATLRPPRRIATRPKSSSDIWTPFTIPPANDQC